MIRRFAFACAAATLATSPTWAQNVPAPATQPAPAAAPSADKFVPGQKVDEWRAAKLVGVTVVGSDNKKLGKISDVLIDHNGAAQVVVISAGGFLGVGASAGTGVATTKTDPAATEASQGYPDVAELDMTEAQLKQAPDFKYAPEPATPGDSGSSASTTTGQSGTAKP